MLKLKMRVKSKDTFHTKSKNFILIYNKLTGGLKSYLRKFVSKEEKLKDRQFFFGFIMGGEFYFEAENENANFKAIMENV